MSCITTFRSPQLKRIHSGKVRESFRIDDSTRLIVTTDRISSFDQVLASAIPNKGAVLNSIANYWFRETDDIVRNHLLKEIDPQACLVREVEPIRIEMIVRGYITGSMWRNYNKGKRSFSGVTIQDGLTKNQRLASPVVTPTTKEESDREITPDEIAAEGWADASVYEQMHRTALALFARGTEILSNRGIILVDTKYEFGVLDDTLILMDEIHTPDSSRFWRTEAYENDPTDPEHLDKEYVRQYLLQHAVDGLIPDTLPETVIREASSRYLTLYSLITDREPAWESGDSAWRLYRNLVSAGIIKEGYVAVIMGSPRDIEHAQRIKASLEKYDIAVDLRICSAHKTPEDIPSVILDYDASIEPGAIIAVAGLSNGLGGALAANVSLPVFSCPPFKDLTDMAINMNSSLLMPSRVPAALVIRPDNAAAAAVRSLNIPRIRHRLRTEIETMKDDLRDADERIRNGIHE